jgi:hypothetical protein
VNHAPRPRVPNRVIQQVANEPPHELLITERRRIRTARRFAALFRPLPVWARDAFDIGCGSAASQACS